MRKRRFKKMMKVLKEIKTLLESVNNKTDLVFPYTYSMVDGKALSCFNTDTGCTCSEKGKTSAIDTCPIHG